jgi:hypothetical protein
MSGYFSVARHSREVYEIEFVYCALSAQSRAQPPPLEPDHDPTCAMARLIASRVMPSFSCFAINAR